MDSEQRRSFQSIYLDGLLDDTLRFWIPRSVDRKYGGFLTSFDRDGTLIDTDKGVWQQCRFTWLLGELFNRLEQRPEWLDLARHGAAFIDKYCFDPVDRRMWFQLTRDGRPIRKRRYAFSESFAAIAYGELAKATGDQTQAEKAQQTFQAFLDHNLNPQPAQAKYTDTRPTRTLGFPMITIGTAQELRESIGLESANVWIDRSIDAIRRFHLKPEYGCVLETVGPDGEIIDHFDGRTLNPGHAIECAWFIMREGMYRNDDSLVGTGCQMLDWMWQRGWDARYGGILYFTDLFGHPVQEYWHDMKFWWPHNEAIIATLLAYHLTGQRKYAGWHRQVHDWAYRHFADHRYGEWLGYLDRSGRPTSTLKGGLWKGPFHLPRMQLMAARILSLPGREPVV